MDTWDKRNATGQPSLLDKLELTGLPLRGCVPYQLEIKDEKDHLCFEATVARNVSKVQGVKFWWIQATKFAAKILQSNSSVSAQLKDGAMEHAKVCEELKDWIEEVGMQDDAWPKGQSGWVHLRSARWITRGKSSQCSTSRASSTTTTVDGPSSSRMLGLR